MEYDCHIFLQYLVFSMKNLVFQMKNLVFRSKNPVFQTKKFEKLGFSHNEYEIPDISSEIRDILKSCNFD